MTGSTPAITIAPLIVMAIAAPQNTVVVNTVAHSYVAYSALPTTTITTISTTTAGSICQMAPRLSWFAQVGRRASGALANLGHWEHCGCRSAVRQRRLLSFYSISMPAVCVDRRRLSGPTSGLLSLSRAGGYPRAS